MSFEAAKALEMRMTRETVCEPREKDSNSKRLRLTDMKAFATVWFGQVVSLLGTAMTGFALAIWVYQAAEPSFRATAFSLIGFFGFAPIILVSPIAGAIVDRYDRRKVMILADLAAGLPSVAVLLLYSTGTLQIWHLFITGAISGSFQAFHFPAYSAAVTMMLDKEQYGRASGMLAGAQFASGIFAPIVAALLLVVTDIAGVLMIDIVTFLLAISLLSFVYIPQPPTTEAGRKGIGSIWKESLYGFRYIYERRSLLGLQLTFFCANLIGTFGNVLLNPMILTRTGEDRLILGGVLSAAGVGGLAGSIVMSIWGGPKRRVHGVLLGMVFLSLFGTLLMGLGREFYVWAASSFLGLFFLPILNGSNQAIWQAKVAPDVQGRVFATRLLIAQISVPVSMLMAGPLADRFFEPAMTSEGNLAGIFGWLVGTGPGTGMSLMFIITGIVGILVGLGAYTIRAIRDAEDILADYDTETPVSTETQGES